MIPASSLTGSSRDGSPVSRPWAGHDRRNIAEAIPAPAAPFNSSLRDSASLILILSYELLPQLKHVPGKKSMH